LHCFEFVAIFLHFLRDLAVIAGFLALSFMILQIEGELIDLPLQPLRRLFGHRLAMCLDIKPVFGLEPRFHRRSILLTVRYHLRVVLLCHCDSPA
jgi:hypothetical protein